MLNWGLVQDGDEGGWWQFQDASEIIIIDRIDAVLPALRRIEERVNSEGWWAAGFISYEAGPAFDPAIQVRAPGAWPLLWMGLYPQAAARRVSDAIYSRRRANLSMAGIGQPAAA